jgi:two-component system chemotaxis response regulator CheY
MFAPETRILVIDDMPSIRELVKGQLKTMGFKHIYEAEDGEAGWEALGRHFKAGEPIGLVVSDWNMPKLKGLELLKRVRASSEFKDLPFVLLTSEAEREQVTEAVLSGVSQYVVKPFSSKTFEDKLKTVWDKHKK